MENSERHGFGHTVLAFAQMLVLIPLISGGTVLLIFQYNWQQAHPRRFSGQCRR